MTLTSDIISVAPGSIIITIINILVLFFIVKKFLFKPINDVIDKRNELLQREKKKAADERNEAAALKQDYEDKLSLIESIKKDAVLESQRRGNEEYNKIISDAKDKASEILGDANKKAVQLELNKKAETEKELSELIADAAAKVSASNKSPEIDKSLYDAFLKKAALGDGR